jgi:small subunit ribosomal protein S4
MIGDRKIDIPSYTVRVSEEDSIHFTPESKIPEMLEKTKSEPVVEKPVEEEGETTTEEVKTPVKEAVDIHVKEEVKTPTEEAPKDESSSTEQSKK